MITTVPFIIHIYRQLATPDWNVYAIVATIDLARDSSTNPHVPDWLQDAYEKSITELAQLGLIELQQTTDPNLVRAILSLVALWKGARTYARMLDEFSEPELCELEERAFGKPVVG